jgi:hypothetical protein
MKTMQRVIEFEVFTCRASVEFAAFDFFYAALPGYEEVGTVVLG